MHAREIGRDRSVHGHLLSTRVFVCDCSCGGTHPECGPRDPYYLPPLSSPSPRRGTARARLMQSDTRTPARGYLGPRLVVLTNVVSRGFPVTSSSTDRAASHAAPSIHVQLSRLSIHVQMSRSVAVQRIRLSLYAYKVRRLFRARVRRPPRRTRHSWAAGQPVSANEDGEHTSGVATRATLRIKKVPSAADSLHFPTR